MLYWGPGPTEWAVSGPLGRDQIACPPFSRLPCLQMLLDKGFGGRQRGVRPLLADLRGDHETHNGTQRHKGVKTWGFGDSPLGQNRLTITWLAKASAQVQAKTFRTGEGVRAKWFAFRVRTSSIVWNGAVTSILKVTKTCLFPWHRSHAREWLISQRLWSQQWIYIRQVGLQNSGG